jgi:hypothetical protein
MVEHGLANHHFATKIAAKQRFSNIIGSRAKATRYQHKCTIGGCPVKSLPYICPHIAYAYAATNGYPDGIQFLCHPGTVGIYYLPYQ